MVALSVLDQSPIRDGGSAAEALAETICLAQLCERLGYRRYWLAEHHATEGFAGTAPEIMVARVAAATSTIRVGSGGVMLSHYSPLKVAEQFAVLEALYPGRIDLGIGRAPGSDPLTAFALQPLGAASAAERYPQQVVDLLGYLSGERPDGHPFPEVRAMPATEAPPAVWLLGSTDQSAMLAALLGCSFSYAHFINPRGGEAVMEAYRESFRRSRWAETPQGSVGIFVICADTQAEAERLAASRDLWRLKLDQGRLIRIPSIATAEAYPYTEEERRRLSANRRRMVVGDPAQAKARLGEIARAYGVDEVVVVTITYDFAARCRSYELLAEAFGLATPTTPPTTMEAKLGVDD